jgi:hypothetical protein
MPFVGRLDQFGSMIVTGGFDETTATNQTITGLGTYYASEFNENVADSIITSGLVMNLDAGNASSYPGSGTTWTDLSGNGKNGTLTNGPTYSSANGGSIVFDGINGPLFDFVSLPANSINTNANITLSFWANASNFTSTNTILSGLTNNGHLQIRFGTSIGLTHSFVVELGVFANFTPALNTIYNLTFTLTKGSPNDVCSLYVNGSFVSSVTYPTKTFTISEPVLGVNFNVTEAFTGNMYNFMSYNRVLSASEILQNYNALIGRFGPFPSNLLIANVFPPYSTLYDEFAGVLYGSGQGTFMRQKTDNTLTVYNEINEVGLEESYVIIPQSILSNEGDTVTFQIFANNVPDGTQLYYEIVDSPVAYVTTGLIMNLDAGNIASYPGSGTTWTDISGNGNNGTFGASTAAPTYDSANGGSIVFDGTNDYVNIGVNKGVNEFSEDFAVSVWVMVDPSSIAFGNIIGDYYTNGISTTNEWQFMMGTSAQIVLYRVGRGYIFNSIPSGYSTNTWINVTISRIGSTLSLYSNANLLTTTPSSNEIFGTNTGNFNIGIDGNNTSEPFKGKIANVMIYKNKGLSESEVLQNFNALKDRFYSIVSSGLVMNLDAGNASSYPGSGTTWTDVSGNGKNGTLTLGPTYSSANGGSIVFDGVDDYVNCGAVNFTSGTSITVEVWVKPNSSQKTNADILDYDHAPSAGGFVIQENGASLNQYYFAYYNGSSYDITSTITLNSNSFNHLVFVKSGTSTIGYLNSVNTIQYTGSPIIKCTGLSFSLGKFIQGAGREFKGNISNTKIYNRALTASEILQNYNALRGRYGL